MNKKYWIIVCVSLILQCGITACDDDWYTEEASTGNHEQVEYTELSALEFLYSEENYSQFVQLLHDKGVLKDAQSRGLKYTFFVVSNENMTPLEDDSLYIAQSHITTGEFTPSLLYDGIRLLTWNGRYVDVTKVDMPGMTDEISISGSRVKRVVKTQNAYIYELDQLMNIPRSLLEILERLPDEEYSIFKQMVGKYAAIEFDRASSKVLGIDNAGNTIYDSVFVVRYPYFEKNGIDLTSSSARMTMLIPNNEVIQQAIDGAYSQITEWNTFEEKVATQMGYDVKDEITGYSRADSIIEQWCFQCAFFKEELNPEDFNGTVIDLYSTFGKQWRTTVNKVDTEKPVSMSNGTAYYITSMKVPQNILIYRIKDYAKWYQYLSESDKNSFYVLDNMAFNRISTDAAAWTPGEGWPMHEDISLWFDCVDQSTQECSVTFYPYHFHLNSDNSYAVQPYMIPPGEYSFHIGFGNIGNMHGPLEVSINDKVVGIIQASEMSSYSRDRGSGGYPEGYDTSLSDKYNRDGKLLTTVNITKMERLVIKFRSYKWGGTGNRINPQHFTFRPTVNCY